ncbi:hypothetical protein BTS2_2700 [Bacillus sp. TS-2]|nr:hypothetical protein BTS2_2700 [Bacillus sp. TS-2]
MNKPLNLTFENSYEKNLTFDDVFQRILSFMSRDPNGKYRLMVGTDSHVHSYNKGTKFITAIVIAQQGTGVWACIRKRTIPKKFLNLHEKISMETSLTEELVSLFTEEKMNQLVDIILPSIYNGASFAIEGHLDIGNGERNKTRLLVTEMIARLQSIGIEPKIKPDAIVASTYANRYTK